MCIVCIIISIFMHIRVFTFIRRITMTKGIPVINSKNITKKITYIVPMTALIIKERRTGY